MFKQKSIAFSAMFSGYVRLPSWPYLAASDIKSIWLSCEGLWLGSTKQESRYKQA